MGTQPGKWWKKSKGGARWQLAGSLDLSILLPAVALAALGVAMVYSATYARPETAHLYLKQIAWIVFGLGGLVFVSRLNYQVLVQRYSYPLYWVLVVLLAVLLATGEEIAGSRRWLNLGPFGIQPSEFAKIATVLVLANYLSKHEERLDKWEPMLGAFFLAGLPMVLILKEPDLGTALIFGVLILAILFAAGVPPKRLGLVLGSGILASPLVWFLLKDYQRRRLMVFLNPSYDLLGAGYNVVQSKIAIGSGRWLGKGWLEGTQGQLRFVPEHHTDFIFSVLAEEWGFVGSLVLIGLFAVLLLQALRVARQARDTQGRLVAVGLSMILTTQVLINLGVATGLLPVTGMTLPLISYGGSSLLTTLGMLGILMSVWSNRIVR